MNSDFDEQNHNNHNLNNNEGNYDEDQQQYEIEHYIIDYEQMKQTITFYLLIFIQILFIFISKWAHDDQIYTYTTSSSSSSSNQSDNTNNQNGQTNNNQNKSNEEQSSIIWSSYNIIILIITTGCLVYSLTLYRQRKKNNNTIKMIFYKLNNYLYYFFLALLSGYVLSKPSPHQNILFYSQTKQTNEYYEGYIPLSLCLLQYIIPDIIEYKYLSDQSYNQFGNYFCSCSSMKLFSSSLSSFDIHALNNQNGFKNRLYLNNHNNNSSPYHNNNDQMYYKTNNLNHTEGGLIHDSMMARNHTHLHTTQNNINNNNHSFYLKTYNNISNHGQLGNRISQIHKLVHARNNHMDYNGNNLKDINSNEKKLHKKLNSINSLWNIKKKNNQLKQSSESTVQLNESDEKWQSYLNQIPSGIILVKKNLNQVKFANEFIRSFFLRNFRKFNEDEILDMILRQIEFKILSHIVNHTSNEKKRITRFSSSAKKQIRESISNAEKKSGKRSSHNNYNKDNNNYNNPIQYTNNGETKNSTTNFSHFHQSQKNNVNNNNMEEFNSQKSPLTQPMPMPMNQTYSNITPSNQNNILKTENDKSTLESILINYDQNHSSFKEIENSTLEIYAKVLNIENKESISLKGKVLYRHEGDEFLIILEDNTKYENVTNLADRDDYKNRLISSFSHELRTPLNSSMGFLQSALLDDMIFQNAKDVYLVPAYQALKLQYYFINDILDFSQILAKRDLQLNFIKFTITKLVNDIKDLYKNSFSSKGISLVFQLDNRIQNWEICTDYDRLMQVFVNLINNSLRFTLKGGITIKISPTIQNNLFIHVIDTGEGMNMQQFEQIKQKLASFNTTGIAVNDTQHTGFGLTISQIIVSILASESNQDLELKKTQGGGCTFSFCIENILNLQTSFSITNSYNTSKLDRIEALKSGTRIISRKDIRKSTYAHKTLEKQSFGKTLQFSSHSLYTKHNKEFKRGNSASSTRIEDLKAPINGFFKAQASMFKKNQTPLQIDTVSSHNQQEINIQKDHVQNIQDNNLEYDITNINNKNNNSMNNNNNSMNNNIKNNQKDLNDEQNNNLNDNIQLQQYNKMGSSQLYNSFKQFNEEEGTTTQRNKENKSQPMIHTATPTNIQQEEGLQTSSFNFYNQQISSYSQQKRFFISQSQAILTSHHNLVLNKNGGNGNNGGLGNRMYEYEFDENDRSIINNDSIISHSDCFENKIQTYNFNSIIHSNLAMFNSSSKKKQDLTTTPSENHSNQNHHQNQFTFNSNQNNNNLIKITQFDHMNKAATVRAYSNQDNVSNNKDRHILDCIDIKTPPYSERSIKQPNEIKQQQLQQQQNSINIKENNNMSKFNQLKLTVNGNSNEQYQIKENMLTPLKIPTPIIKRPTPSKQNNNVKFFFQVDSKTTSDKEEQSESFKTPQIFAQPVDLKYKLDLMNELGERKDSIFNYKDMQKQEDNNNNVNNGVNKTNGIYDDKQQLQQIEQNKDNNRNKYNNINHKISEENSLGCVLNNNNNNIQQIKTLDNMNNIFQNQMQLSEHFSEISWQHPPNINFPQNQINSNQILSNQKQLQTPKINEQINQQIFFNINRMKQIADIQNQQSSLGFINLGLQNNNSNNINNNQQSHFNDTETANFLTQKEYSIQQSNAAQTKMKSSGWVRKASLQLIEKQEKQSSQDQESIIRHHQMSEVIERPMTPHLQIIMKCQCRRILCVDDEIFNLQVLLFFFKKLDYEIEKSFNGKEAINIFIQFYANKNKYQCESPNCTVFKAIILDCNMPVMNGWDCAKELRNLMNQKKLPSIPIIALTAYVTQQAFNQCIESGMDHVLNKPINIDDLRNTVENYIHLYETDQKNIQWV